MKKIQKNQVPHKVIVQLINEVNDNMEYLRNNIIYQLSEKYHLTSDILEAMLPLTNEEIDIMTDDEISEFIDTYKEESTEFDYSTISSEELKVIKNMSAIVFTSEKEANKIKEDSSKILDEYVNYLNSSTVKKYKDTELNNLRQAAETESNDIQKKKINKMIDTMEAAQNFSFLYERFDKLADEEVKNIMDGYFINKKGQYVLTKYGSKMKQFGYNPNLMKYFFNIEENFLPEEYHIYNNLFLFIFMRMIAYSDPYNKKDKMYIQSLTGALADLIYHKFESELSKKVLLDAIKKVLDNFKPYADTFEEDNTTHPKHPVRKEQNKNHEVIVREGLYRKLNIIKYDWGETNPDELEIEEIQKIYNEYKNSLISNLESPEIPEYVDKYTDAIENSRELIDSITPVTDEEMGIEELDEKEEVNVEEDIVE